MKDWKDWKIVFLKHDLYKISVILYSYNFWGLYAKKKLSETFMKSYSKRI